MSAFRSARSLSYIGMHAMKVGKVHQRRVVSLALPAMQQTLTKLRKGSFQDASGMPVNKYDLSGTCGILSACPALFSTSAETLSEESAESLVEADGEAGKESRWPSPVNSQHMAKRTKYSVFAGGYNFDYNENSLKKLFSQFGEVSSVSVPLKNTYIASPKEDAYRFAFIYFTSEGSFLNALQQENITTDAGETVQIQERSKSKRELENERTFIVQNLPNDVTADEFVEKFQTLGNIELANFVLNSFSSDSKERKSYAFITFKKVPDPELILNSSITIGSNIITIQQVGKTTRRQQRDRCQKIFVENLSSDCTEETLSNHFGSYGTITFTKVFDKQDDQSHKVGIVQFTKQEEAVDACKETIHNIEGIHVTARCLGWIEKQQDLE